MPNHNELDLTGQTFGNLYVIKRLDKIPKRGYFWLCQCNCGSNPKRIQGSRIKNGYTKSCGCLTHQKDGIVKKLLTKEYLQENYVNKKKKINDIAKELNLSQTHYIYKYLKLHGISERNGSYKKVAGDISHQYFDHIRRNAESRNLEFSISPDYIWQLFIEQNRKCALSGRNININISKINNRKNEMTASLDRINSNKGYIIGNVQWIHKELQPIKMSLSNYQLFMICQEIYDNMKDMYK